MHASCCILIWGLESISFCLSLNSEWKGMLDRAKSVFTACMNSKKKLSPSQIWDKNLQYQSPPLITVPQLAMCDCFIFGVQALNIWSVHITLIISNKGAYRKVGLWIEGWTFWIVKILFPYTIFDLERIFGPVNIIFLVKLHWWMQMPLPYFLSLFTFHEWLKAPDSLNPSTAADNRTTPLMGATDFTVSTWSVWMAAQIRPKPWRLDK